MQHLRYAAENLVVSDHAYFTFPSKTSFLAVMMSQYWMSLILWHLDDSYYSIRIPITFSFPEHPDANPFILLQIFINAS